MSTSNTEVTRTILSRVPIPQLPGWEARTVMLDYPPGVYSSLHFHPSAGANYIVRGTAESTWEDGETGTLGEGEVFMDWAEKLHTKVGNPSLTEPLKIVVTYVIQEGDANVKFVEDKTSES